MPKTICVIDDETDILEELEEWLGEQGYYVMTASNGREGLEKMEEVKPHLIILDIIMPRMDGFEILSHLKRDSKTSKIPVIMLTAKKESGSIMRAQSLKAEDYISKPFNGEELLKSIRRHI